MGNDEVCREVELAVRRGQVRAVVSAIQQGRRPRVGDILEHTIDVGPHQRNHGWVHSSRLDTYEFQVEMWHLDEADADASDNGAPQPPNLQEGWSRGRWR